MPGSVSDIHTNRQLLNNVLFCIYIDGLLQLLCKSKVGCFIDDVFVTALAYADDLVLLACPKLLELCGQCV